MGKVALVVDDSPTIRNMVKVTMQQMDFEVVSAQDGMKALKAAKDHAFDVIITDINMPNMDGIELIKMLREENEANKFAPILVLSTEGGAGIKGAGKQAGASGWIVKPFNPEILQRAVSKVCGL